MDDFIKETIWGFTDEEDISPYIEQAGYDSNVLMFCMGLELYITIGFVLLILILIAIINTSNWRVSAHRKEKLKAFKDKYLFNGLIAVFIESTLETTIALTLSYYIWNIGDSF